MEIFGLLLLTGFAGMFLLLLISCAVFEKLNKKKLDKQYKRMEFYNERNAREVEYNRLNSPICDDDDGIFTFDGNDFDKNDDKNKSEYNGFAFFVWKLTYKLTIIIRDMFSFLARVTG